MRNEHTPNEALRRQRLIRGWSLQRVADEISRLSTNQTGRRPGINANMVGEWERGIKTPGPFYREKLCQLYHTTAEHLMFVGAVPAPLPAIHVLTHEQAATLPVHQLTEGRATNVDTLRRKLLRLGITGTALIIVPHMLYIESSSAALSDEHLAFLEDELASRWMFYHTAGAAQAHLGLDVWMQEVTRCAHMARGTPWYGRTHVLLSMSYQLQACILRDLMQYPQAHKSHKQAFLVAQELHDPELMAAALVRQGITLNQQDCPLEAISSFHQALETVRHQGYTRLEGYTLQALSEAQAKAQQAQAAVVSIGQAEKVCEHPGMQTERSLCRLNSASLTAQRGVNAVLLHDYNQAITLIERSLSTYDPSLIRGRARLFAQKAEAYHGLGIIDACVATAQDAFLLASSVGSRKTIDRVKSLHAGLLQSSYRKERAVAELSGLLS